MKNHKYVFTKIPMKKHPFIVAALVFNLTIILPLSWQIAFAAGGGSPGDQAEGKGFSSSPGTFELCGKISTVAGTGQAGFSGDGGPATEAALSAEGLTVDKDGNLYISGANRVRKVDENGIITTVAGGGSLYEEGIPATQKKFNQARWLAMDSQKSLYVVDAYYMTNAVFKVDDQGILTRFTGQGKWETPAAEGLTAYQSGFEDIGGIAFDAEDNSYIADGDHFRIRKISNGIATTLVGHPATSSEISPGPRALAMGPEENLYFTSAHRVQKVNLSTPNLIETVAGTDVEEPGFSGDGGPAGQALLGEIRGIAVDASGNIYISDMSHHRVRRVDTNGIITTIAGNGNAEFSGDGWVATQAALNEPSGLAVDGNGNLYIADSANQRVRKVTLCKSDGGAKLRTPSLKREEGFVHPSQPPEKRVPPGILERKAGVPPILKQAAPATKLAPKPSLLQRIKGFFSR